MKLLAGILFVAFVTDQSTGEYINLVNISLHRDKMQIFAILKVWNVTLVKRECSPTEQCSTGQILETVTIFIKLVTQRGREVSQWIVHLRAKVQILNKISSILKLFAWLSVFMYVYVKVAGNLYRKDYRFQEEN